MADLIRRGGMAKGRKMKDGRKVLVRGMRKRSKKRTIRSLRGDSGMRLGIRA